MRHPVLRSIVLALLLLTFVGGSWVSAAAQTAPQPCPMAMKMAMKADSQAASSKATAPDKPMPCQDSAPGCAKRICCLIGATLLIPSPTFAPLSFGIVQYVAMDASQGGRSIEPELFPPIHV